MFLDVLWDHAGSDLCWCAVHHPSGLLQGRPRHGQVAHMDDTVMVRETLDWKNILKPW